MDPRTGSFIRFDYPSQLPLPIQERMSRVAARAMAALGLEDTMFNIEMIYDAVNDRVGIIEVNGYAVSSRISTRRSIGPMGMGWPSR